MDAIKAMNKIPLPRNLIFEKANAAIDEDTKAKTTAIIVTTIELKIERVSPETFMSFR